MLPFEIECYSPHLKLLGQKFQGVELIVQPIQLPLEHLLIVLLFLLQPPNLQYPAVHNRRALAPRLDQVVASLLMCDDLLLHCCVELLRHLAPLLFIVNDVGSVHISGIVI